MSTERAADIIAKGLTGDEAELLMFFGRENVMAPEEFTDAFRSLLSLRLIEGIAGGPKVIITLFGREVLAQVNPPDRRC
ncbi:hypothetical protein [Roseovarius sp. MMSF_3359]|uniref:hypothetical protein n=1 Tax=Roseovarius sp. MMSF_3359 TaxID=3046707 RepID=UPI00273EADA9|nr:hypothetical protein [Roseovarius sp. MMSF_3359]